MPALIRTIKASTVRGYTLETRRVWRGWWLWRTARTVNALIEHRRTTYAEESMWRKGYEQTITTVNESAIVHTFEDSDIAAAIHTLAHHNAQLTNNELYSNYQHD